MNFGKKEKEEVLNILTPLFNNIGFSFYEKDISTGKSYGDFITFKTISNEFDYYVTFTYLLPNRLSVVICQYHSEFSSFFNGEENYQNNKGYSIYSQWIEMYLLPANVDGFLHAQYKPDYSQHYTIHTIQDVVNVFEDEIKDGIIDIIAKTNCFEKLDVLYNEFAHPFINGKNIFNLSFHIQEMSQALSGIVIAYLAKRGNYEKLKDKYLAYAQKELVENDNDYPDAEKLLKIVNYLDNLK